MIESIRYLLGAGTPKDFTNRNKLVDENIMFVLEVIINGISIFLGRIITESKKGYIKISGDLNFNLDNWKCYKDKDYKKEIEELLLKNISETERPSFASIREYIIRDEKSGFTDLTLPRRSAISSYEILSFLLGINCKDEWDILELKNKQQELQDKLKVIETLNGDISEIKINEKKIQDELDNLTDIVNSLNIKENIKINEEEYKKAKNELKSISGKIIKLEHIKDQYRTNIDNLVKKVDSIKALDDIKEFYKQIANYFPEQLEKNYDEILEFYNFMVDNRGKYFESKIAQLNTTIEELQNQKVEIEEKVNKEASVLKNTTVIEDLNSIIEKIKEKNSELADLKLKVEQYSQKDTINKEINKVKQEVIRVTNLKQEVFDAQKTIREKLSSIFNNLVQVTYGESGILELEYNNKTNLKDTTGRVKINCSIIDENSHGRQYMKINMFDITWLLSRVDNNFPIKFLFHDGSYVKPDNKEAKYKLLNYVDNVLCKKKSGQYFVTLNKDELEKDDIEKFINEKKVAAFLNRESDENRFMGMKYV
jgi:uncharacterized protein YydD (DUF2326 family)